MNIGDIAEQRIIKLLNDANYIASKNEDKATRSHYDISVYKTFFCGCSDECMDYDEVHQFDIEVKNDVYALKSGNIAVEMFNPKSAKPSGLTATKSDLWVFMVGEELWVANTEALKKYVEENKPFRIIDSGGDNNAYIYLYKKDVLFPAVFHQINHLNDEELVKKLEGLVL